MVDEKPVLSLGSLLLTRIFQAFRMAIQPSKLALAFAAVTIIALTGGIMDLSRTVVTGTYLVTPAQAAASGEADNRRVTELDIYLLPHASLENFVASRDSHADRTGVFATLCRFAARESYTAVLGLLSLNLPAVAGSVVHSVRALVWVLRWHPFYSILFFTVAGVVLAAAGGGICRIAALQFSRGEKPSLQQAARFARRKIISLLGGLVGPVVLVFVFGLPILLLGLVGNVPYLGELLTGLLLLPTLAVACVATITLIGAVGGTGLICPAVAYEDSDSFDAINHSFSYLYSKPWHLGLYTVVAAVYGALCYLFVRFFAFLLLWTTYRFLAIGFVGQNVKLHALWPEPTFTSLLGAAGAMPDAWSWTVAAVLIRLGVLVVLGLMVAFVISFYFSASTIIYTLMRYQVDQTPLAEVCVSPDETAAPASSFEVKSQATPQPATAMDGGSPS